MKTVFKVFVAVVLLRVLCVYFLPSLIGNDEAEAGQGNANAELGHFPTLDLASVLEAREKHSVSSLVDGGGFESKNWVRRRDGLLKVTPPRIDSTTSLGDVRGSIRASMDGAPEDLTDYFESATERLRRFEEGDLDDESRSILAGTWKDLAYSLQVYGSSLDRRIESLEAALALDPDISGVALDLTRLRERVAISDARRKKRGLKSASSIPRKPEL